MMVRRLVLLLPSLLVTGHLCRDVAAIKDSVDLSVAILSFAPGVSRRARAAVQSVLPSHWQQVAAGLEQQQQQQQQQHRQIRTAIIELRMDEELPLEGFTVRAGSGGVQLLARTDRGFIFAASRLLRELRTDSHTSAVHLPLPFELTVAPPTPQIRGTQLTTAAVGKAAQQRGAFGSWESARRYVKELAIFGGNTIELSHPSESDPFQVACLGNWSRLLDQWDLNVHLWLPVNNNAAPFSTAMGSMYRWLFGNMSRLDSIHIPGGDGGPGYFCSAWFESLKQVAAIARVVHPKVKVTCSANSFNSSSFSEFLAALARPDTQQWLDGLQIGKEEPLPLAAFIARVASIPRHHGHSQRPPYYFLRVPDITHTVETGFPVPLWDYAWSSTHGREAIFTAPRRFGSILRMRNNGSTPTIGYSAYSEGLNDDYNKALWSALTLEPSLSAENLTRQYARIYFGAENEASATFGLLGLEANWIGRAANNPAVPKTLAAWQRVNMTGNWRRDMYTFRAAVDMYHPLQYHGFPIHLARPCCCSRRDRRALL